jgi:hypothetical protein
MIRSWLMEKGKGRMLFYLAKFKILTDNIVNIQHNKPVNGNNTTFVFSSYHLHDITWSEEFLTRLQVNADLILSARANSNYSWGRKSRLRQEGRHSQDFDTYIFLPGLLHTFTHAEYGVRSLSGRCTCTTTRIYADCEVARTLMEPMSPLQRSH